MDRPWHLRGWSGINMSGWYGALARNRFQVSLGRVPMAGLLCGLSVFNSALGWVQRLCYGRRIAETQLVDDPIFVIGHWRSGTTLVHELLACDSRHTFPNTAACFGPSHFLLTGKLLEKTLSILLPPHRPMDNMPIRWENPQEDEWALANLGLPSPYLTALFPNRPPQDPRYVDLRNLSPAELARWRDALLWLLRCVTIRDPKRIVLKTPLHTARVRVLLDMFPRARFVHMVRDPYVLFPSTVHTWKRIYQFQAVQTPRFAGLEQYVLDTFVTMYRAYEEDAKLVPAGQLCNVRYEDLTRDMRGEMRRVYEELGLGDFEVVRPAIDKYLERTAEYRPNRHHLASKHRQAINRLWAGYFEKYGYQISTEAH